MAKQVSEILVKLGIQGADGLDKLKSSFRELEKSLGPSTETIERARKGIIEFGKESKNTEQLIKGQIEALRGLQSQTERGSTAWAELAGDIERFRQASRKTDGEIQVLRQSILSVASGTDQSQKSLREYIGDLSRLRNEATITGGTFQELSRDIAALTGRLQEAEQQTQKTGRVFGQVLGQALASTSAGLRRQIDGIKELINEQQGIVNSIDLLSKKERELAGNQEKRAAAQERLNRALVQQRQLGYAESIRAGRETVRVGAAAFNDPSFLSFERIRQQYGDLPDTTAGLNQELSELSERLLNTTRGSNLYVETANRMAEIQRELRTELTGTAEAFRKLGIAQDGVERRADKLAGIQEYYRTQGPLAPGAGGYRDPVTGAMIMAGAREPGRIRVDEAAYPTPIGPQAFPEAGRRAQEQIQRSLDDVNRIYEDARVRRAEIQTKYDQIHVDKLLEGLELEGRVRDKGFKDELAAFDRQLEARDRRRRGRLTTGQAVQSAGAIISGGIFGGPEGFAGGLGGFAAGLAIPALGPVGGAFAGAAAGAQISGLRQAAGAAAEYAAEIRRLQLALQGVVYSFDDYRAALRAINTASEEFNIPIQQSTQQFTKLTAAVIGSGGTVKDAENTFKGLSAAVLGTGGSIQDVNGALVAAAQVFSKGKVSAEELRGQIGERLAGAFALFAESSNTSTKQLDKDLQNGEVTLAQFVRFTEFALQKYGRTARIIADSPEQAGARLDRALKNLQKNVGDALGPTGAAFQDFATRAINALDRLTQKLIDIGAVQPGAGYYVERVLGRESSIKDLELQLARAGAKASELRSQLASIPTLQLFAKILPGFTKPIEDAEKQARILEEALIKLRLIEKETNKERKQRQEEEGRAEKEKLGQQYLQALEQREQALGDARRQREEQIAKIRKDAIEASLRLERDLGDERRNIERDIERVRREMQYGAGEIDRLRRLAAGEDPEIIEAERRAAEIGQKATEDKIKIQEDLLDKELQQQRTIADFQKNTAKQIADANEGYAKRVGEIQRDFAKASAKIIEEGSGAAAKRITTAAQIISQVLQRTALNQQRAQYGLQPIGEPTEFKRGQPVYGQMTGEEVPPQIKRIDINLEQLLKKLQESPRGQASLPGRRVSSLGIGEQFLGMLGSESGYEDVAGLLPLPIQRMQQQAARPLRMIWQKIQGAMEGVYGATEKQIKETFKPDPLRNSKVLQRIQQTQEAILNWDPLEAQWKETQNQLRQTKRSKPASMPLSSFVATAQQMRDSVSEMARKAGGLAAPAGTRLGSQLDFSDYLSEQQKRILATGIKEVLNSAMDASFQELRGSTQRRRDPSLMPSFERATSQIQGLLPSFRAVIQEALSQEAAKGQRYAMDAMKKFGMPAPVDPDFYRSLLYEDPSRAQERLRELGPLNEPPRIPLGIESQFEGAMLPRRSFDISRMTRNLGNVATAGSLAGLIPAAGATTQLRQQGAQQQIQQVDQSQLQQQLELFSNITGASRDTYRNLQDQSREIELQVKYLSQGHEPALARELASLQQSYETQKRRVELQAQALIGNGANKELVTSQLDIELQSLDVLNKQNQALAAQNEKRNKAIQDAIQLRDAVLNPLQQGFGQAFDLLIQGTENWGDSLRNIAATVLQDIARQLIQIFVINQAISAISKLFPTPGGTIPVTAVAANGLAFAKNGIQPFAMGGIVNKPTLFKYADGGTGRFGLMGEAGPEAIIPLKRGRDGRLGVAGGGGVNVGEINISVQNTGESLSPAAQKQLASQVRGIVLATLVNEQRGGGVLR